MTKLMVPIAILLLLLIAVKVAELLLRGTIGDRKSPFQYRRKDFIMTRAERECFDALIAEMGAEYHFFPQVHLDAIVSPQNAGRGSLYAFRHINQKSIDFVACEKRQLRPIFALELDDKTHSQPERVERDREVGRILHGAGIPLVRIENRGRFDPKALAQLVRNQISENRSQG